MMGFFPKILFKAEWTVLINRELIQRIRILHFKTNSCIIYSEK